MREPAAYSAVSKESSEDTVSGSRPTSFPGTLESLTRSMWERAWFRAISSVSARTGSTMRISGSFPANTVWIEWMRMGASG